MEVKLLRHTPEPEKTVAMSARLCYSPVGAAQLEETMSDEQAAKLVRKLVEMGHFSTLEHVTFTFAIEGVSRVLTHQLVRHRIASYSQQSQRYVKEHNFETPCRFLGFEAVNRLYYDLQSRFHLRLVQSNRQSYGAGWFFHSWKGQAVPKSRRL